MADENSKLVSRGPPDVKKALQRQSGLPQSLVRKTNDPAGPLEGKAGEALLVLARDQGFAQQAALGKLLLNLGGLGVRGLLVGRQHRHTIYVDSGDTLLSDLSTSMSVPHKVAQLQAAIQHSILDHRLAKIERPRPSHRQHL